VVAEPPSAPTEQPKPQVKEQERPQTTEASKPADKPVTQKELGRCSTLSYNLGIINDRFIAEGFDKNKLLQIIQESERQWEQGVSKNLFEYTPSDKSNLISFSVNNDNDLTPGEHDGFSYAPQLDTGAVEHFEINAYPTVFDKAERVYNNFGGTIPKDTVAHNVILFIMLHEMGHAFGLGHINLRGPILSGIENTPITTDSPSLTKEDIAFAKAWCAGSGRGY
jgi:hypothetical protein